MFVNYATLLLKFFKVMSFANNNLRTRFRVMCFKKKKAYTRNKYYLFSVIQRGFDSTQSCTKQIKKNF